MLANLGHGHRGTVTVTVMMVTGRPGQCQSLARCQPEPGRAAWQRRGTRAAAGGPARRITGNRHGDSDFKWGGRAGPVIGLFNVKLRVNDRD